MPKIIFDGKTYNSVEEIPALQRQAYEQLSSMLVDKNGNGIPDFLEGDMVSNVITAYSRKFSMDGKVYNNVNELPEDVRDQVKSAFEKISELGLASTPAAQSNTFQVGPTPQITSQPMGSQEFPSAIQDGGSSKVLPWVLAAVALFFCLAIAALGVFYFLQ
jgi:hypothetical protein